MKPNQPKNKLFFNTVLYITIAIYIYLLIYIILIKSYVSSPLELFSTDRPILRALNLIPFKNTWNRDLSPIFNLKGIIGNILIFTPLGIYLQTLKHKFRKTSIQKDLLIIFLCSLSCEIFQYIFATGISDITDLMLNFFGGVIGIFIYKFLSHLLGEERCQKLIIIIGSIVAILMIFIKVMLFIKN